MLPIGTSVAWKLTLSSTACVKLRTLTGSMDSAARNCASAGATSMPDSRSTSTWLGVPIERCRISRMKVKSETTSEPSQPKPAPIE